MIASKDELMKAFKKCALGCDNDGCVYLEKANALTQKRYDNGIYCSCTCAQLIAHDALELLKEQQERIERFQPKVAKWVSVFDQNIEFKRCTCCDYLCMGWDGETGVEYDYCPNCGAKIEH